MKKMMFFALVALMCLCLCSCDQFLSRRYGGTMKIELEPNEKLVEATWKDNGSLWYLVEPMDSDYTPKTKVFKEDALYGVLEGKVIFIERR